MTPIEAHFTRSKCRGRAILDLYGDEFDLFFEAETGGNMVTYVGPENENEFIEDFDILDLNSNLLMVPYYTLREISFRFLRKVKPSEVKSNQLNKLTLLILQKHNYVAYHNFAHGFSVMQFFNQFLHRCKPATELFDQLHTFVCLLACLGHDVGHQAKNNAYQNAKQSRKSIRGLNSSVLEKFHAGTLLNLINNPKANIFEALSPEQLAASRRTIIEVILATDIANHFSLVQQFQTTQPSQFQKNDNMLSGYIAHCGDLGNSCLDYDNYLTWAKLVTQEFHDQTISETKNGLKVTQFMVYRSLGNMLEDQIGFVGELSSHFRGTDDRLGRGKVRHRLLSQRVPEKR
jgi:hypothetical protein